VNDEPGAATVPDIAREVLRYLDHNPEAKDTLDGIAQWWLRWEQDKLVLVDVEQAVSWLCSQGLLIETCRPGVPPYYQLNSQQREAISKILKEMSG
jgi:hypothetical protein